LCEKSWFSRYFLRFLANIFLRKGNAMFMRTLRLVRAELAKGFAKVTFERSNLLRMLRFLRRTLRILRLTSSIRKFVAKVRAFIANVCAFVANVHAFVANVRAFLANVPEFLAQMAALLAKGLRSLQIACDHCE
jgi:hypothetical protein